MLSLWIITSVQSGLIALASLCLSRYWFPRAPRIALHLTRLSIVAITMVWLGAMSTEYRPFVFHMGNTWLSQETNMQAIAPHENSDAFSETRSTASDSFPWGTITFHTLRRSFKDIWLEPSVVEDSPHRFAWAPFSTVIAVGITWQLFTLAGGLLELFRLKRDGRRLPDSTHSRPLVAIVESIGHQTPHIPCHAIQWKVVSGLRCACVSWLEPNVIYLPENWQLWSHEELKAAIAHEIAHIRQRDALWRFLSLSAITLLWFDLGLRSLVRQLQLAQEFTADQDARQWIGGAGYLHGFSKLAIRLDTDANGRTPKFGVAFSHSELIRRIDMLHQPSRISSRTQRLLSCLSFALLLAIGCFAGSWRVEAQEPLRIARLPVVSRTTTVGFQREPLTPWTELPQQNGFMAARLDEILKAAPVKPYLPLLQSLPQMAAKTIDLSWSDRQLDDSGIAVDNLKFAMTSIQFGTSTRSKEETDDTGKSVKTSEQSISCGTKNLLLDTHRPIDWKTIGQSVSIESLHTKLGLPKEDRTLANFVEGLTKQETIQTRSKFMTEAPCGDQVDPSILCAWQCIDGGLLSLAVEVNQPNQDSMTGNSFFSVSSMSVSENADGQREPDVTNKEPVALETSSEEAIANRFAATIRCVGVGIDSGEAPNEILLRLALVPCAGTTPSQLASEWQTVRKLLLSSRSELNADDTWNLALIDSFETQEVIVVEPIESKSPGAIVLTNVFRLPTP